MSTTAKNGYQEDLSAHRIDYSITESPDANTKSTAELPISGSIEPSADITEELDEKLVKIAEENKSKLVSGYTIQVYTGSSRDAANNAKDLIYRVVPNARPQIQYIQPNYKVKVGKFVDRIEAQKIYMTLKEEFPSAMIIPERFSVQ